MAGLDNKEIAAVFMEMADLTHIQGGDPYRIRAFRRTARVVENLAQPVETSLRFGSLGKTPGIGEGSVYRIKQILRSGTCTDLQRLRARLPGGLRELLEIKGLGARRVRWLYQQLRIGSVDELELACRTGQLARLPRFGPVVQQNLLRSIQRWRNRPGRMRLSTALRIGGGLVEAMREHPAVLRAELTGSARRRKPTVGDLDVLVASGDAVAVASRFVTLPQVDEVVLRGEGRCQVRLHSGHQVDLRVLPPSNFGAGLHYFTGSQLHNIALRARGNKMGVKISDHGAFRRTDEVLINPCRREEEVFAAVGLPWIPPELRENIGEIVWGAQGRLPTLIEVDDLKGDLHMHTTASDGQGTARQMAEAGIALGHEYIAITDHSKSLTIANGLDETRLLAQMRHLRDLEQELGRIRILCGIEVDILEDGSLDLDAEVLRHCDWVVASVHSHFDMSADAMTGRMERAIETGLVDVIGHPTGRRLAERPGHPVDLDRLMRSARKHDVALEINGSPHRMDLDGVHCRAAKELGVDLVISTDSHAPEHMPFRQYGVYSARRGWLGPADVLNTRPVEVLLQRRSARLRSQGVQVDIRRVEPAPQPVSLEPVVDEVDPVPEVEAPAREDVAELADCLRDGSVDEALRARLQAYVMGAAEDPALDRALREVAGENPLAAAFGLLVGAG